jgi:two-component system, cell cycle response regulator
VDEQGGGLKPRRRSNTFRMDNQPELVELPKDRCTLTMLTGPTPGAVHPVKDGALTIGRDETLPWHIPDRGVSSQHARIIHEDGAFAVEDLDSTNGTFLNGRRISQVERLRDGDRIQLGENTLIRVSLEDATEHNASQQAYDSAVRDPLTGVYNRGHLEAVLVAEFAYAARHKTVLSVIFTDLDHFSRVNNTYGHQAGDQVLRVVAQAMRATVRTEDVVARYGGEEFVMVARGIDLNGAIAMAERVRQVIERQEISVPGTSAPIKITASLGVASHEAATTYDNVQSLVAAADRAVYRAKSEGRNRVCETIDTAPESWRRDG